MAQGEYIAKNGDEEARDAQGGSTVEEKRLGGTSETQTKITQTDMTTEEKAKAYAENIFGNPITPRGIEETRVARNAYLAGAAEALASQWKEIERDKDGFTTDECLDTMFQELPILLWHNTDEDGEYVDRTKWADYAGDIQCDYHHYSLYMPIPIPPLKGGDA